MNSEALELWVGPKDLETMAATSGALAIRRQTLFAHLDAATRQHPIVADPKGRQVLRKMARRFADVLHRRLDTPATDETVFRECMYYILVTELSWHWTIRQAARALARRFRPGPPVFVELANTRLRYGLLGDDNELWPLSLVYELNRAGRSAILYVSRSDEQESAIDALEVEPGRNIVRQPRPDAHDLIADALSRLVPGTTVFCPKTVRNWKVIHRRLKRPIRLMTGLDRARPVFRIDITPTSDELDGDRLPLRPGASDDEEFKRYRVSLPARGLARSIVERLDTVIEQTFRRAERVVGQRKVRDFYAADHPTLEGAAFAVAVKRHGGRVHLWPHASNPIAVDYRAPLFDTVVAPTKIAAREWREHFPSIDVHVDPSTVLPPFTLDAPRDERGEITLVMFGIRCFAGGMPRFDYARHEQSLRDLVQRLSKAPGVRFVYKPKDKADAARFDEVIDPEHLIERTDLKFARMNWPNMVFTSPTIASTAIIEGIFRGIPAVLLRDTPAWDHVPVDDSTIPVEGAAALSERLQRLRDRVTYDRMATKQADWLRSIVND